MAAKPEDLRFLIRTAESMLKEMDSLRSKSEIPAWEKKEMRVQRQIERLRKKNEKEKTATKKTPAKKTSAKKPSVKKTPVKTSTSRLRGGMGGMRGGGLGGPLGKQTR